MEIKEAIIKSIADVFPLYMMNPQFKSEEDRPYMSLADDVNVLSSFSHNLKGNIVFGFSLARALKIASLMKGEELQSLDREAKSTMNEITKFTVNLAISKFKAVNSIYISPPVLITGDGMNLMISIVKTTRLVFQIDEDFLSVAYYIEKITEKV
jgi:CheY-specific phosphatase CheX